MMPRMAVNNNIKIQSSFNHGIHFPETCKLTMVLNDWDLLRSGQFALPCPSLAFVKAGISLRYLWGPVYS